MEGNFTTGKGLVRIARKAGITFSISKGYLHRDYCTRINPILIECLNSETASIERYLKWETDQQAEQTSIESALDVEACV